MNASRPIGLNENYERHLLASISYRWGMRLMIDAATHRLKANR